MVIYLALNDLLKVNSNMKKIGISEERIAEIKEPIRQYVGFWRMYPDIFVDFMQTGGKPTYINEQGKRCYRNDRGDEIVLTFSLFFYQRVFIRISMRFKYVYAVYPRAYSKSFLSVLVLMIRCILYPGAHLFSAAGGKEQSSSILEEKTLEICDRIPAFRREIDWRRGATSMGKDHCKVIFKNGSHYENLAARESTRGQRKHAGLLEECVGIDQKMLQEVLIPLMNVSRPCMDGTTHEEEVLNQSQVYITTAGQKNTYSYDKLIQTLVQMITEPEKAFIMGGTWRLPVAMGLQPKNFLNDLKKDPTFNEASFEREYESHWSGTAEDAFFDGDKFDRNRIIQKPEMEYSGRSSSQAYYVLSVDVGRKGCQSVICIFKVTPQVQGFSTKSLVNMYTISDGHFEDQAIKIKKLFYKYKARRVVIDGNGLGIGLLDYMIKSQTDSAGDYYPPFGVYNDPEGYYKKYRTDDTEDEAIYIVKANAPINTEAYSTVQSSIESGKIKFLVEERIAKNKLLGTKMGQAMTPEQRAEYLIPYKLTDILKMEMLNLREENEGINIILKQSNKRIAKDKFSALCYGLYYIKQEEDSKRKKKKFNAKDWKFFN